MIALLRYGSGFPFHRLQRLQEALGIPLAASVQWKLVHRKATLLLPVFGQLQREAAQGEVISIDDTTVKILTAAQVRLLPDEPEEEQPAEGERTGSVTTGMVSRTAKATIVLYRSGSRYAGENLKELLSQRDPKAGRPIQMSDGLNRNHAAGVPVLRASCNAHSRRRYVELIDKFPEECGTALELFKEVYRAEAQCRARELDPQQRLEHHRRHSAPAMEKLRAWANDQIEGKHVEPNSTLGQAIRYMLKRWEELTLFLRVPGAPIGRVDGRRGGGRLPVAPVAPFGRDASIRLALAPSPAAARRTGRAGFPHPALIRDFPPSLSSGCYSALAA